ncbi:hypothetical protein [Psychroserpens sp. SPM9]|uniref:hypothetical protein n=1 Tax=Psychroserpens sp. SPM9 TaxID=2975598 RepID=UPI0021A551EF|nr:hypothetical protein [Psychroserpens sp. SPM9]MDG5492488.1 hypothetical protein [Psychroserpens sp. SPM9]
MKRFKKVVFGLICLMLIFLNSCVSDVDFDQTENILPTPVFESSLMYSNLEAPNFIDEATQQEVIILTDTTRLEYINSDFFVDQLIKTNLNFQFANSLDRHFSIDFEFVNDADELRYLAEIEVPPGQPNAPSVVVSNFLIEEPELSVFEEATKLIFKITLPPSTNPIDTNTLGRLELDSKVTFYFEL